MYTSHFSYACGFVWEGFDASVESSLCVRSQETWGRGRGRERYCQLGTYTEPSSMTALMDHEPIIILFLYTHTLYHSMLERRDDICRWMDGYPLP